MAFKKGSPLRKSVDEFLAEATKSGGKVDELLKKWVPAWEQYRVQDR
jgi:ABC-type amino acid transport substrate-binding protein